MKFHYITVGPEIIIVTCVRKNLICKFLHYYIPMVHLQIILSQKFPKILSQKFPTYDMLLLSGYKYN